jgi:hypothetical protein
VYYPAKIFKLKVKESNLFYAGNSVNAQSLSVMSLPFRHSYNLFCHSRAGGNPHLPSLRGRLFIITSYNTSASCPSPSVIASEAKQSRKMYELENYSNTKVKNRLIILQVLKYGLPR